MGGAPSMQRGGGGAVKTFGTTRYRMLSSGMPLAFAMLARVAPFSMNYGRPNQSCA